MNVALGRSPKGLAALSDPTSFVSTLTTLQTPTIVSWACKGVALTNKKVSNAVRVSSITLLHSFDPGCPAPIVDRSACHRVGRPLVPDHGLHGNGLSSVAQVRKRATSASQ